MPPSTNTVLQAKTFRKMVDQNPYITLFIRFFGVICTLFLFLLCIEFLSESLNFLGYEIVNEFFQATSNPFIGLFIGLLTTAILQSSSTVTSALVAIVASGLIGIEQAVPIIMGANIGTTVTSTMVSLGHMAHRIEFKRAISAATMHDFFNIIVALILFPLEYFTGFLSNLASFLSKHVYFLFAPGAGMQNISVKPLANHLTLLFSEHIWIAIALGLIGILISIKLFTKLAERWFIGESKEKLNSYIFARPYQALGMGALFTSIIQSSSVTTSVLVPLVAAGKVSVDRALPFLMGANVGTTMTALIAATSRSEAAVAIALAHFLFNFLGVLMLFPIPVIRQIPLKLSNFLGEISAKYRLTGFLYVLLTFFVLPFLLIYFSR